MLLVAGGLLIVQTAVTLLWREPITAVMATGDQSTLSRELERTECVEVVEVVEGSPAAEARLRPEDLIVDLNGQPVEGVDDLQRLMAGELIGPKVVLNTVREGRLRSVELVPVELDVSLVPACDSWPASSATT